MGGSASRAGALSAVCVLPRGPHSPILEEKTEAQRVTVRGHLVAPRSCCAWRERDWRARPGRGGVAGPFPGESCPSPPPSHRWAGPWGRRSPTRSCLAPPLPPVMLQVMPSRALRTQTCCPP